MLPLLIAALLAQAPTHGREDLRTRESRRVRSGAPALAFFEAFPISGRGTFGPCSTTAPTGAKGEVLTFTRATAGTCTKGTDGLRSTSIADGDLVSLGVNVARVELDADGIAGLLVEGAASPITIQSRPICNAAWADVGTPACAANATTGPWGTATMAILADDDPAAKEGRSQTMATTSATRFTAYCYVKAGATDSATLTLAGTGNTTGDCSATITGLSPSTSSIISCTSAVAYTGAVTAVTLSILVGDDVSLQDEIFVEGCNVVPSATYRTSFTDAAAVTVSRGAEVAYFAKSISTTTGFCSAATLTSPAATAFTAGSGLWAPGLSSGALFASPYIWPYTSGAGTGMSIDGTGSSAAPTGYNSAQATGTAHRYIASNSGALARICKDATCTTGVTGAWSGATYTHVKLSQVTDSAAASIWTCVMVDLNWQRCGP